MSDSPSHLKRFLGDPAEHLSGYGVFYGDERMENGEPLPTGTLRMGDKTTASTVPPLQDFGKSYQIKTNVSATALRNTLAEQDKANSTQNAPADGTLGGTAYQYSTGTFVSQSGLPPTQYKAWTSEYGDEYRGPEERARLAEETTARFGTEDALNGSKYQFRGYPFDDKTYSPTSLTARGQNAPNYESRVVGF